ncbi:glycosyltransferase [Flavobacterium sp. F-65]|uniref:Glycosyltransferase n=1 Tax=Flavobacterium pisciphilum TaxID=2893755 RepID=A0ABS8MSK0_9FLAO|nr:glycosyltransferase [Flavobacterium sp. F-65]MCC9071718.1 glycosyltransferase [Flavobacterium sp. F-65]
MLKNFSVLMSVYDKENPNCLRQSLESICNQTLIPNEIIIVKDGPLNIGLDDVVNEYVSRFSYLFVVIELPINKGLAYALNEGMKHVKHDIVARMDSDDICIFNRFEIQVNYLINNNLDIVGGQIIEFSKDIDNIVSIREVPLLHDEIVKFMKFRSPFSHPTIIFKRKSFELLGGYDKRVFPEDYDLFVRAYLLGLKFGNVKEKVLYFRLGEDLSEAIKRRWGMKYAINEIKLYRRFLKLGFFGYKDFTKVFLFKIPLRVMPFKIYRFIYFKFAR